MSNPILRQLDMPNLLTLAGLILGLLAALLAIQGSFYGAAVCLIYAGIIDLFDGFVAKRKTRTELQAEVGKHLDTIVDICSFGFAPVIFAYSFGLRDPLSLIVLIIFLASNAIRLAYYDSTGLTDAGREQYYTGLPVTYNAMFIPMAFTLNFILSQSTMKIVLVVLYVALAIAMVANFQMRKLVGVWYAIFFLGALTLTIIYSSAMIIG